MERNRHRAHGGQGQPEDMSRRRFGRLVRDVAVTATVANSLSELGELLNTNSKVVILPGQKERFKSKEYESVRNGVLVIGGATVQDSTNIAKAITPGIQELGPVMAVDWSSLGFDINSVAKNLKEIKSKYGMENLSLYFHSMGDIEAGLLMPHIADDFTFPMMVFDDSIIDISDLKVSRSTIVEEIEAVAKTPLGTIPNALMGDAKLFTRLPFGYLTSWALQDGYYYHNWRNRGIASPALVRDQEYAAENGRELIDPVARVAKRDGSITLLLQPHNSAKDPIQVDRTERELKLRFPNLDTCYLTGDTGHANDLQAQDVYNPALSELIKGNLELLQLKWQEGLAAKK